MKRSALKRRTALRSRRKRVDRSDPARMVWKTPREGFCSVCGARGVIVRHHVLYERKVRDAGRDDLAYDLRNALDIGAASTCSCHHDHHWASRRIPLPLVSDQAVAFAVDVLGSDDRAALWFARYYAPELAA